MENLDKTVNMQISKLIKSKRRFQDVFEIMFDMPDNTMTESTDGFHTIRFSYRKIKDSSVSCAYSLERLLEHEEKGSFIGLALDNSPEWIWCFWGILMAGFKPLLINTRLIPAVICSALNKVSVNYIIGNGEQYGKKGLSVDNLKEIAPYGYSGAWADELALMSSGTSLDIKLCVYCGNEICEQILTSKDILRQNNRFKQHYNGCIKLLAFLPFYHIFGLMTNLLWFGFFGRTFVFLKDYSGDTIMQTCRKHGVTHIFATPLLWNSMAKELKKQIFQRDAKTVKRFYKSVKLFTLLQGLCAQLFEPLARRAFKEVHSKLFGNSVRFCISGGSYLSEDALYLLNGIGIPLYNGYGMTEIGITSVELSKSPKVRNLNSVGKPLQTVSYKLVNVKGKRILAVKGSTLCKHIYSNATESFTEDGYYITGDIANSDQSGRYYIEGRSSDVVISQTGENISPDVVENAFELDYAKNFTVLGLSDNKQTSLCLIVEVSSKLYDLQIQKLKAQIIKQNNALPKLYMVEKIFFTNDSTALKNAIKPGRKQLLKWIESGKVRLIPFSEYRNENIDKGTDGRDEIRCVLVKLFAEVLGKPENEIASNAYFVQDLGGNSLEYFTLLNLIEKEFGVTLARLDYRINYTVDEFCEFICNNV
ncbi:MAG: AMP-binding protein [Clostridia bacterium]|nr:AMP-binding protein [Clostridia bacterium]